MFNEIVVQKINMLHRYRFFPFKDNHTPQILINIHQTQEVTDSKFQYFKLDVTMVRWNRIHYEIKIVGLNVWM